MVHTALRYGSLCITAHYRVDCWVRGFIGLNKSAQRKQRGRLTTTIEISEGLRVYVNEVCSRSRRCACWAVIMVVYGQEGGWEAAGSHRSP